MTASDGSPRFVRAGDPGHTDDVAEVEVDGPGPILGDEQLDLPGAVDEVEEDELPHVPPSHDPPSDTPRLATLLPGLDLLGLDPDGRNLVPVGKSLRQGHARESKRPPVDEGSGPNKGQALVTESATNASSALGGFDVEDLVLQGLAARSRAPRRSRPSSCR